MTCCACKRLAVAKRDPDDVLREEGLDAARRQSDAARLRMEMKRDADDILREEGLDALREQSDAAEIGVEISATTIKTRVLNLAARSLRAITDEKARLAVIVSTAARLAEIDDDDVEARDRLAEIAYGQGLDADKVTAAIGAGRKRALDARTREQAPKWQPSGIGQDATGAMRESATTPFTFDPKPYQFRDPATIPPRQWLYGRHYMRGVVSATLGAPGRLKSTTLQTEVVGMSAGLDLIGGRLLECGPLRAAYFNGEETQDELDRRVAAIMQRYSIAPDSCAGRLWVMSTRDTPMRLAIMGPKGNAVVAHDVVDAIETWCEARSIDVFCADPLVSFHQVRENDPGDMDLLFKQAFGRVAGKGNPYAIS
jgi:hypothetical protein